MKPLVALAPAKVNLRLAVGRPRPADGLHPVVTVIQTVSLADELRLEFSGVEDEVRCPGVAGPNLAAAALAGFRVATGWDGPPLRLTITKRVPIAAGMGGGSSDAAAALRLLARAAGRPNDDPVLAEIAATLGSDVPALLHGGRTLGTGAGERVTPLESGDPLGVLVLPSDVGLATPAVYAEFDRLGLGRTEGELTALAQVPDAALGENDLEPAARSLAPSIDAALATVRATGASRVLVSGSGPTVVGLFLGPTGPAEAARAAGDLPRAMAAVPVGPDFGRPTPAAE